MGQGSLAIVPVQLVPCDPSLGPASTILFTIWLSWVMASCLGGDTGFGLQEVGKEETHISQYVKVSSMHIYYNCYSAKDKQ